MKPLVLIFLALILGSFPVVSQEVDLVRLDYTGVKAGQIGMAVSADHRHIVFAYDDFTVKVFDIAANRFVRSFKGPFKSLFGLELTTTNKVVFLNEKELQVWNWKEEKMVQRHELEGEVSKTAFLSSGNFLAVGQKKGITSIFDLETGRKVQEIDLDRHHVGALAFHPNGKHLAIGVLSDTKLRPNPITVHDFRTGERIATAEKDGYYTMVAYDEKGSELITSGIRYPLKSFIEVLDGSSLEFKRSLSNQVNFNDAGMPRGGIYVHGKVLGITKSQSFNVSDGQDGSVTFTTKANKVVLPNNTWTTMLIPGASAVMSSLDFDNFQVYPLNASASKVLLNATKNNVNQIYDVGSNSIIGYFFSDSNEDFAFISRDGRVDGTAGALSKVYWTSRNSLSRTFLESSFEKNFTPKLMTSVLTKEQESKEEFVVDAVVDKVPALALQSGGPLVFDAEFKATSSMKANKVRLKVTRSPGEVVAVQLYQNTKLVRSIPNNGSDTYDFDVTLTTAFGEDNYFYAVASSRSGVDSDKTKFIISYKGASEERPRLFLVTIGINQYKNPKYNLNYAQADADGFDLTLQKVASSLFREVVPFSIRNDAAIKERIVAAFDRVKADAKEQDMLIVYYAGHGVVSEATPDQDQEFFVVPHDVTQLYGRNDLLHSRGISAGTLKEVAGSINAQKQVFILDACQSAGALKTMANRGAAEEKAIAQLARSTGTFWITATGTEQFASEFTELGHGIFTYLLLEGLNGKADANTDKKLTIRELSTYLENSVPELSEKLKGSPQYPSAYSFGNDFPIVIYK